MAELAAISEVVESAGSARTIEEGIYEFTDLKIGLTYVGQSGNISRCILQHVAKNRLLRSDIGNVQRVEVLGGKTAREIQEQMRIDQLGGIFRDVNGMKIRNLANVVNPVSKVRRAALGF